MIASRVIISPEDRLSWHHSRNANDMILQTRHYGFGAGHKPLSGGRSRVVWKRPPENFEKTTEGAIGRDGNRYKPG
jgi:hypothetical protein